MLLLLLPLLLLLLPLLPLLLLPLLRLLPLPLLLPQLDIQCVVCKFNVTSAYKHPCLAALACNNCMHMPRTPCAGQKSQSSQ